MHIWNGKHLTSKQYNARLTRQNNGLKRRKNLSSHEESDENSPGGEKRKTSDTDELQESDKIAPSSDSSRTNDKIPTNNNTQRESLAATLKLRPGEGRRIVELEFLGQQMWYTYCKEALSLQFIEGEIRRGLCSVLTIRCHKCLLQNQVSTSKSHSGSDKRTLRYDVNTKSALGALHAGLGWTHVDKFLSCVNIPCYDYKTFKRYEIEVGVVGEAVARESCENATELERQMIVERQDILQNSL